MKHYAANKSNQRCEVFQDGENESDLLKGILSWWEETEPQYARACIDVITFFREDNGLLVEVYWSWLDKETDDALIKEIKRQHPLEVDETQISGN